MPLSLRIGNHLFQPGLWPSLGFVALLTLLLSLAAWQWQRAGEKQALIDGREAHRQAAPLDLGRELPDPELDRFRPAVATGRYLTDQQWLLDNRLYRGQPGYHVFSLFRTREGRLLLVNRGWISMGESREFLPELPLPEGRVRIGGHLDRPESVGLVLGEPPYDSIARRVRLQSLDVQALARARGLNLPALTLVLDPQAPGALQYDWQPAAGIGPEKHLGYAVQWLALATALVIIYVGVNTRRIEHDEPREET
ncbi:MAG TPA: SURF1 family protein [Gammaproteobacteria bacterium]|nr:SURF1 family protein [Gammaproteobacteria bacterium]